MALEITHSEWMAEMERLWNARPQDEGFTVAEWSEALGWGYSRTQRVIKDAVRSGVMVRGQRFVAADWDGRSRSYTVYRPKGGA